MTATSIDPGSVSAEFAGGISTIRFSHPKGNSLPAALLRRLADEVTAVSANPEARVIVLRSEGSGPFCAGASFDELTRIADSTAGKEFFMGFARLILAMIRSPKLVITRVQGKVVGGGVGVAAASDYVVALGSAQVKLSELAIGIGPFVVGPVIEKKLGLAAFSQMAVDAASWRDARWAHQHGLFSEVTESPQELDSRTDAIAERLAASNPDAMSTLKRIFWTGTEQWDTLLEERAAMSGTLVLSEFTRNAIASFKSR